MEKEKLEKLKTEIDGELTPFGFSSKKHQFEAKLLDNRFRIIHNNIVSYKHSLLECLNFFERKIRCK